MGRGRGDWDVGLGRVDSGTRKDDHDLHKALQISLQVFFWMILVYRIYWLAYNSCIIHLSIVNATMI